MTGAQREKLFREWRNYAPQRKRAIVVEYLVGCEKIYSQESFLKFIEEKLALEDKEVS
ncbi:MAG: hypothetical protein ACWGOX_08180 [Desulforhopalus sp.]